MFLIILAASVFGSVAAMAGGVFLLWRENWARRVSLFLVSFAAGSLLGAVFFEILPEILDGGGNIMLLMVAIVGGFLLFFLTEKFLRMYHCHDQTVCDSHVFTKTVLAGDTFHNFFDGVAIAAAFLVNVPAGIATTAAIFLHEIPQEMGDFGVMLHAGYSKGRVFFYNFISALANLTGATLGYFFLPFFAGANLYFLALTAGSFLYIAAADLIPEVHRRSSPKGFGHALMIFLGVVLVLVLVKIMPE